MPTVAPLPQEIIRTKRDGGRLDAAQIAAFVHGLVDGGWADAQAAALAMAIVCRGMDRDETVALTGEMTRSGTVLRWDDAGLPGPVLDKHSTGGVGDKVSLMLAPMLAACGAVVPMISGRGLGHTGGTLDKLEALPGYRVMADRDDLRATLKAAGCAIVGAGDTLAPADRRLYAIRDVTATVDSVALITASILSKKLAAGLQALVLDVKCGNGAVAQDVDTARTLARSLVQVARGAGLPTVALVTDMNQVLGDHAGNALEVREAIDFLTGARREPRLLQLTLALGAEALVAVGLDADVDAARRRLTLALYRGEAAEHFARMVAARGGPRDVLKQPGLPVAPVVRPVPAPGSAFVVGMDTRALGLAVVALGGGRRRGGDAVDPRVGLADCLPVGAAVQGGSPLAFVHAADDASADAAVAAVQAAYRLFLNAPRHAPVVQERIAE
jgi:thymidine phosphorylase